MEQRQIKFKEFKFVMCSHTSLVCLFIIKGFKILQQIFPDTKIKKQSF